jgi:hypothetical protein
MPDRYTDVRWLRNRGSLIAIFPQILSHADLTLDQSLVVDRVPPFFPCSAVPCLCLAASCLVPPCESSQHLV